MIALSTTTYDPNGAICLPNARPINLYEGTRRGTVTATLDMNCAVYDAGFSASDQTLQVKIVKPTQELLEKLRYLIAYYSQINLSYELGFYQIVFSFKLTNENLLLNFRLISRLDV